MFLKQRFWIHIVAMGFIAILLAACGGESNSSTGPEKDTELAETSSSNVKCSSSEKKCRHLTKRRFHLLLPIRLSLLLVLRRSLAVVQ